MLCKAPGELALKWSRTVLVQALESCIELDSPSLGSHTNTNQIIISCPGGDIDQPMCDAVVPLHSKI